MQRFDTNTEFGRYMQRQKNRTANMSAIIREAPEGSALAELRDIAAAISESRGVTPPEAFGLALQENPHLYEQYLREAGLE